MSTRSLCLIICLLVCTLTVAQTRRSLIIGLGEQEDSNWGKINGDKDVLIVRRMLNNAGYKSENIMTLKNAEASKSNIECELGKLVRKCQKGDIVYIHFSGHGQQMTDINDDEINDGWDESWIPYDAYRSFCDKDNGNRHFTDDELNHYFHAISTAIGPYGKLLVVVDACHSGDIFRGKTLQQDCSECIRGVFDKFIIPSECQLMTNPELYDESWITISACKDYMINTEIDSPVVAGKLTYSLFLLSQKSKELSNDEVREEISEFMRNHPSSIEKKTGLPQVPDIANSLGTFRIMEVIGKL